MKLKTEKIGARSAFLPLQRLQALREAGVAETRIKDTEPRVTDFIVRAGEKPLTFRYGVDFVDGNERLRWTPTGIENLIAGGLWRREFDRRGNLKSKPVTPEAAMKLPGARSLG